MRNELLQERASRQDLECDKIALERQVHTLLSGGKQIHTVQHDKASTNPFHSCLFIIFIWFLSIFTSISDLCFETITRFWYKHVFPVNYLTTSVFMTSAEQRPEEHSVSSRGLPEVQQRGPGSPAGGAHTGAGEEAGRGGKVRQRRQVGKQTKWSEMKEGMEKVDWKVKGFIKLSMTAR